MVVGRSADVGREAGKRAGGRGLFLAGTRDRRVVRGGARLRFGEAQLAYVAGLCLRNEPCCRSEDRAPGLPARARAPA